MAIVKSLVDTRIATTKGHVIRIPADTPTHIPDACLEQALLQGCAPVQEQAAAAPAPAEPSDEMSVLDACRIVLQEGDPSDITGDGRPKAYAVARVLGRRVTAEEVIDATSVIEAEVA
jgi:hypothetical protein